MRSAYERGYEVVTLTDCVAATSAEEHDNAIKFDYPMFSELMTGDEFTAGLSGSETATDASRGTESPFDATFFDAMAPSVEPIDAGAPSGGGEVTEGAVASKGRRAQRRRVTSTETPRDSAPPPW